MQIDFFYVLSSLTIDIESKQCLCQFEGDGILYRRVPFTTNENSRADLWTQGMDNILA